MQCGPKYPELARAPCQSGTLHVLALPVGSASIILGKVDSGRFFYFFLTRSEPFREFSFPLELQQLPKLWAGHPHMEADG